MVMPARGTVLDEGLSRPATPRTVDFSNQREIYYIRDEDGKIWVCNKFGIPMDKGLTTEQTTVDEGGFKNSPGTNLCGNAKQVRARARRRLSRGERLTTEAWSVLYKPLEEWDAEELARGRPRNDAGTFQGRPPKFVTRELHERAMERFKTLIRDEMNSQSITALRTIQMVLESEEVDNKGKPIVSAAAKMDAAKFLLEHVVGKPTQPTQSDVSVKLQGILGAVMVNPSDLASLPQQYVPAHIGTRGELTGDIHDDPEEL